MMKVIFSIGIAFLAITFNARAAPVETRMSGPKVVEQTKEISPLAIPTGYQIGSNGVPDKAALDAAMKLNPSDAAAFMGMQSGQMPDISNLGSMNLPPGLPDNYKNMFANMPSAGTFQDATPLKANIPIPSDSSKTADGANAVQPTAQKNIDSYKEKMPERPSVMTKDFKSDTKPLQLGSPPGAPIDPIASNDASKAKLAAQEKNADKTVLTAKEKPEDANAKKALAGGEASVKLKVEANVNTELKEGYAVKPVPVSSEKIAVLKTAYIPPPPPASKSDTDTAAKKPFDGKPNGETKPLLIETNYKQSEAKDQIKHSSIDTEKEEKPEVLPPLGKPRDDANGAKTSDSKPLRTDVIRPADAGAKDQQKPISSGAETQVKPAVPALLGKPQDGTKPLRTDAKPMRTDASKPAGAVVKEQQKPPLIGTENKAKPSVLSSLSKQQGDTSRTKIDNGASKPAGAKDQPKTSSSGTGNQEKPQSAASSKISNPDPKQQVANKQKDSPSKQSNSSGTKLQSNPNVKTPKVIKKKQPTQPGISPNVVNDIPNNNRRSEKIAN